MRKLINSMFTTLRVDHASVMKNFFSLTFLKGLEYLVPLFLVPYLVRSLGIERYGIVQSAVSFMYIFLVITNFGFNYSAARQISIHRNNYHRASQIAGAILLLKTALMLLSFVLMMIIAFTLPSLRSELGLIIITFGFIIGDVLFPVWLYQGYEKMYLLSRFQIVARLALFVGVLIAVKEPDDYLLYPSIYYGTQIIMALATLLMSNRLLGIGISKPTMAILKEEFILGAKPFMSSLAQVLYTQPRVFYVSLIASKLMTGTFAIADKAAGVFQLFPVWLFVISALPRLSYMYEHDREQCLRVLSTYQRWTSIYALITLPIALFCAPWIIYAFSGSFNEEATMFFRVLCLETFILTVNIFLIHYFPISGQFGTFAKIYGVTCIVTLILFIVLSHFMGVFGIVLSILLSAIFVLLLTLYHRSAEVSLKN